MNDEKIIFFKDSHSYWFNKIRMSSVGSYLKQYFPEFDENYWLTHGVLKEYFGDKYTSAYSSFGMMKPPADELFGQFISKMDIDLFMDKKEKLAMSWDFKRNKSAYFGTMFHSKMEDKATDNGFIISVFDGESYPLYQHTKLYDNESICMDLYDLEPGVYAELLIFNLGLMVAGQADEVFIRKEGKHKFIDINDHKTNEKLPAKSDMEFCKPPFDDIRASTHFKYTFQINMYAYMLSLFGFKVGNLAYTHYKNYDETQKTVVEVENIQKKLQKVIGLKPGK